MFLFDGAEGNMPDDIGTKKPPKKPRTRRPRTPSELAGALRVWREREVLDLLGIGRTTLWRWVQSGNFPEPMRMGPSAKGWLEPAIKKFLASRTVA